MDAGMHWSRIKDLNIDQHGRYMRDYEEYPPIEVGIHTNVFGEHLIHENYIDYNEDDEHCEDSCLRIHRMY